MPQSAQHSCWRFLIIGLPRGSGLLAARAGSIATPIAGRALQGAGAVSGAVTALVADVTRVEVRTRAMAVIGISVGASFVLSILLGPVLAGLIGVRRLFVVAVGLAFVAIALVLFAVPGYHYSRMARAIRGYIERKRAARRAPERS